jgi:hypothetical protein
MMPVEEDEREEEISRLQSGPSFDDEVMQKFEGILTRALSQSSPEKKSRIARKSLSMPYDELR